MEEYMEKERLQWHPAFFAGMQIELKDEADNLIFENEYQLGTKPLGIDILIIKKDINIPMYMPMPAFIRQTLNMRTKSKQVR